MSPTLMPTKIVGMKVSSNLHREETWRGQLISLMIMISMDEGSGLLKIAKKVAIRIRDLDLDHIPVLGLDLDLVLGQGDLAVHSLASPAGLEAAVVVERKKIPEVVVEVERKRIPSLAPDLGVEVETGGKNQNLVPEVAARDQNLVLNLAEIMDPNPDRDQSLPAILRDLQVDLKDQQVVTTARKGIQRKLKDQNLDLHPL